MNSNGFFAIVIVCICALCVFTNPAQGETSSGSIVYRNQYLTVRTSVQGVEDEILHLGDVLFLKISLEYESDRVRIINLDKTLLDIAFNGSKETVFLREPTISYTVGPSHGRMEAVYGFQLVGCPEGVIPCPGGKVYRLPNLSLGLELIDGDGRVISTEEINFQPWPGYVSLASTLSLNNKVESFEFYFPRRAFGVPVLVEINSLPALLLLTMGLMTISGMVLAPAARTWLRRRVIPSRMGLLGNRWERVLDKLQDENINYDEFSEGIRVAITWYCHDLFKINTTQWSLNDEVVSGKEELMRLKMIFRETLQEQIPGKEQRREMLSVLANIFAQR